MENSSTAFERLTEKDIALILKENYGIKVPSSDPKVHINRLDGEEDKNYWIAIGEEEHEANFLLKVILPSKAEGYANFYEALSTFIQEKAPDFPFQFLLPDTEGRGVSQFSDLHLLLCKWLPGRKWSSVNPISDELLHDLGIKTAQLSLALQGFEHPWTHRNIDWDLAQADWTAEYLHLFEGELRESLEFFINKYDSNFDSYQQLRKSVIQNDGNDNNILVSGDLLQPRVEAIIDFGDAVHSQLINNLAITCAYAIMGKADPLRAAAKVIEGHHEVFPLEETELGHLHTLIGMRLATSLCKSAINKKENPQNTYLLISEKPARNLIGLWRKINPDLAHFTFRKACKMAAHPSYHRFENFAKKNPLNVNELFRESSLKGIKSVDMGIGSKWLGARFEFTDDELKSFRLKRMQQSSPDRMIAGGYLENRAFYSTNAYKKEGNNGPEYRSVHLGIDFWDKAGTAVFSPWEGEVYSIFNNDHHKDYGPTLILRHQAEEGLAFFSLYGHLSQETLKLWKKGMPVRKGELIAYFGEYEENGHWTPHLHFQLMLDMLGNEHDFSGVAFPEEIEVWKEICPDPNLFFNEKELETGTAATVEELIDFRQKHLGRGLSLSYQKPLHILRGEGAFLLAHDGRQYLDTANNVAHCGHEHPRVVRVGQQQMALLNTNTRYLHENLIDFTEELISKLPPRLSVVHLVNSGSEANELALRMAQTFSGQEDFVAVEVGYHGNTNKAIEVSSYKFDGKGGSGCPPTTHLMPLPDSFRGKHRGEEASRYASYIHSILQKLDEAGKKPAGFICESILSCGGQIELPAGYLAEIYPEIRKRGALCIADEVQVGLGRVGSHFSAFELQGVVPDILTLGKPIGNGHPIGVVVCTEEVADAFANGMEYFNTFGGNPVSCAIGTEVLRIIKDEALQAHALGMGNLFKNGLVELQKEFPVIGDVRGQGLFLGFELTDQNLNPLGLQASYLANRMRELGILMSTDGPDHNVIKIKPPMVIQPKHIEECLSRIRGVLREDFCYQQ